MNSIDNINELGDLRVHIAPVGFEVDRIVIPLKQKKADRVWLLIHNNPSIDQSGPYVKQIVSKCKEYGIEVKKRHADRMDLFDMIRAINEIVNDEKDNLIYINVASGSKIQAISCMMACMMLKKNHNLKPFYAIPEKYTALEGQPQSFGVKNMKSLPVYEMQTPKPILIHALKIISEHDNKKITKKEMALLADKQGLITVNPSKSNLSQLRFVSLQNNIIEPLEKQWKFIHVEKIGRNHWITLTSEGKHAVGLLV